MEERRHGTGRFWQMVTSRWWTDRRKILMPRSSHKFVSPKEDVHPDGLWLGFVLSALGTLVTFVYLRKVWDRPAATEESSPPRPGTITSTLQILCITSLNVSYGAMISSMTIFVLPKEAEHFYPRQSSLGLGLLEFVAAVCLLCGPVAGQIWATWHQRSRGLVPST